MVVLPDSDYRDDVQLITAANNALAQNVTVPDGVEAVAFDGDITLTGTVTYISQRAACACRKPMPPGDIHESRRRRGRAAGRGSDPGR